MNSVDVFLNPIRIFVLITFIHALFALRKDSAINLLAMAIISLCLGNEIITAVIRGSGGSILVLNCMTISIHTILWLILINRVTMGRRLGLLLIILFSVFALFDFYVLSGKHQFNYNTFLFGALLYISHFLIASFHNLSKEQFGFFTHHSFILIFAPVLFFVGLGLMLAFGSHELSGATIYKFKLWDIIINFVNLVFYALMNLYIFKDKRLYAR